MIMSEKSSVELTRYKINPFIKDLEISVRNKNVRISKMGKKDNVALVDMDSGDKKGTYISTKKLVDSESFLKLFTGNIALTFDLKSAGIKAFNVVCWVMQNSSIEKDKITIDKYTVEDFNEIHKKKLSKPVLYRGLKELIINKIIARSQREGEYFINPAFVFNGDRLVFTTIIERNENNEEVKEVSELEEIKSDKEDINVVCDDNNNENFPFTNKKKAG
jgi:hypothetical protein